MMLRFATFAVVLFAVVLSLGAGEQAPAGAGANGPTCEADDCFSLWTSCIPITYAVVLSEDNALGLTRERVENAVESRLRAARMLSDTLLIGGLMVGVTTVNTGGPRHATSVSIQFRKYLYDPLLKTGSFAAHYIRSSVILHNGAGVVMESVAAKLDEFVNDYLRVNEPACAARAAGR